MGGANAYAGGLNSISNYARWCTKFNDGGDPLNKYFHNYQKAQLEHTLILVRSHYQHLLIHTI